MNSVRSEKKLFGPVLFDETGLTRERIKSLRIVIYGIAFGTVCFNITNGIAMTGYLKSLGVSDFTFGLLIAIAPAAGLLQILASFILERTRGRRTMFLIGGFLHRLVWLPFGLIPFFIPMSAMTLRIWIVTLFIILGAVGNQLISLSYQSLLADLIPIGIRGSFLGMRGRVSTVMGILGGFMSAWFLDQFPGNQGYALVFALATVVGSTDIILFFWAEFPPMIEVEKQESISFMLVDTLKNRNFLEIAGFITIWHFSINLATPFYLVYTRMSLGFSNTVITLVAQILPNICSVLILTYWGRLLDKKGLRPVMLNIGRLSSIAPMLWLFVTPGPVAIVLVAITYVSTGLLIPGMELCSNTAILNRSPEQNRSMFLALYHCVNTFIGGALANATAGWLLDNPLSSFERMGYQMFGVSFTRYNYLFFLSFVLRAVCAFILLPRMISQDIRPRQSEAPTQS